MNVTVCWDKAMEDHKRYKKQKYEPFAAIINDEMCREGVVVGVIVFGTLGSVGKGNVKAFKLLDILDKSHAALFKDINCIIATDIYKIWEHVKLIMSFTS